MFSTSRRSVESGTAESDWPSGRADPTISKRWLGLFTTLRPGEGKSVSLFFSYAFLLLVCYYIFKTLKEPLLLENGSAELKSYAYAVIAVVLLIMVPAYGVVFRKVDKRQLTRGVTGFFIANLACFYFAGQAGVDIGFVYFVWLGVFGVTIIAQFWAHAAHAYGVKSGERLFPVIMAGATLGAVVGPPLVGRLFPLFGPWNVMLIGMGLLAATLPLVNLTSCSVPESSRSQASVSIQSSHNLLGGIALVARDRYLLLLALLVVLLNCVNTTGEFILTELVLRHVQDVIAAQPGLDKGNVIAGFYGDYYFTVNVITLFLQIFLVARIFRWIGVRGSILLLPVIAFIGYGLVVFVPIFAIIRAVKIFENSTDYSIMNTARHALYLPLPTAHKYEGKTAVDTFFWRLGDVVQAGVIYVGLNWFDFEFHQFAVANMFLALLWLGVALRIGRHYGKSARRRLNIDWRRLATGLSAACVAVVLIVAPATAEARPAYLFSERQPIEFELVMDMGELCRNPNRKRCQDVPAMLLYQTGDRHQQRIEVSIRSRGRWREDTGNCSLPALFVFFSESTTRGTVFEGQDMLPLTTHCQRHPAVYERYVLKEYLAYRIYELLTTKSLGVKLARITYRDSGRRGKSIERYGFFTEHFDSLAQRHHAEVWDTDKLDARQTDPMELAALELFQFMIGNTDWSAIYGHNIVVIRDSTGLATAVPYDFDFSGLVDAQYAGPSPKLKLRSVTERLYRGFCRPDIDWDGLFLRLQGRRDAVQELLYEIPRLELAHREQLLAYLDQFFDIIASPDVRAQQIVSACRPTPFGS